MRIVKSIQTKVCVDGSLMKEFILDEPFSEESLGFLRRLGTIRILQNLRKPYFTFEKDQFISIKGFVGDSSVEVRYKKEFQDLVADYFHLILYYERKGESGIKSLQEIEEGIQEKMALRTRGN